MSEKEKSRSRVKGLLAVVLIVTAAFAFYLGKPDQSPDSDKISDGHSSLDEVGEGVAKVSFVNTDKSDALDLSEPSISVPKPPSEGVNRKTEKPAQEPSSKVPLSEKLPSSFKIPGVGIDLVLIRPGKFQMGSPEDQPHRRKWEQQHTVTLTQPYLIGKFEVTQQQWQFFGEKKNRNYFKGPRYPMAGVTWFEATQFCRDLTSHVSKAGLLPEGHVFRLPTEAEWEYACRAGTSGATAFGDSMGSHQANFDGGNPCGKARKGPFLKRPQPVGFYKPNAWGLYDMHGNVWEWCHDIFFPLQSATQTDPWGLRSGRYRVAKGGGYLYHGWECRSTSRCAMMPSVSYNIGIGFRVALGRPQSFYKK